jgi:hypothetical protein
MRPGARLVTGLGEACYPALMSKLFDQAVETVRALPASIQDDIAHIMLSLAGDDDPEAIDSAHLPVVLEGLTQAGNREFATLEEAEAAFRRFGA